MPKKVKDPLVAFGMRLPQSYLKKIDKAALSCGKTVSRTAVTKRLIDDGLKWWAREDLEQDTALGLLSQMHERTATTLAMLNVMANRLGYTSGPESAAFRSEVQAAKRTILKLKEADNGLAAGGGGSVRTDPGDDRLDDPDDDDGGSDDDEDGDNVPN